MDARNISKCVVKDLHIACVALCVRIDRYIMGQVELDLKNGVGGEPHSHLSIQSCLVKACLVAGAR